MQMLSRRAAVSLLFVSGLAACGGRPREEATRFGGLNPNESPRIRGLIDQYAETYDVPADLIHRIVQRESSYNPGARNGPYFGLMQILPQTAHTMGYRGQPDGLLDAETNLKFGVKYLRGAWLVSRGNRDKAVMWYSKGYYYEAKRLGLLKETGLRT